MRAAFLPSGSLSISIGHQDSVSQAWVPGGAFGLKNIVDYNFLIKKFHYTKIIWVELF
jgi:hypothetical protein